MTQDQFYSQELRTPGTHIPHVEISLDGCECWSVKTDETKRQGWYLKINKTHEWRVWVGFWKAKLDELPQFWNVLIGEMSLVGTRPPTADEVAQYNERHWQRLNVKPGITGEWQVNGRSSVTDFEEVVV